MKFVRILTGSDAKKFDKLVKEMPCFIKLFSPGCGHCIAMKDSWDSLNKIDLLKNYNIGIVEIQSGDALDSIQSQSIKNYRGFPTLRRTNIDGSAGKEYSGNRSVEDMTHFIQENFKDSLVKKGNRSNRKSINKSRKNRKRINRK